MQRPTFLAFAVLLLASAGCNQRLQSICQQRCECKPCTDADMQTCLDDGQAGVDKATTKSCTKQMDEVLSCMDDNLSCQLGSGPGTDKCTTQQEALFKCAGLSNPFATTCEEASVKSAMCAGVSPPVGGTTDCPAISACQSACVLDASCDVIIGATFDPKFQDCVNSCSFK